MRACDTRVLKPLSDSDYDLSILYFPFKCTTGFEKRMRHLGVSYLSLRDCLSKRVGINKIPGVENPADVCTKYLDSKRMMSTTSNLST